MAPPPSRRSKQGSSPSPPPPIPLPGIALGLFAAIAAGFAASRLRRKSLVKSLQDEQPAATSAGNPPAIPLLVQEREIEIKEKDDLKASAILFTANGTIAVASHELAKPAAGLKTVFDALEETSLLQENGAKPVEERRQEEEEEGVDEFRKRNGTNREMEAEKGEGNEERECEEERVGEDEGDEEKKAEALENGEESSGEEGEMAEITVKIEASLIVDEASMEALQASLVVDEASMEALQASLVVDEASMEALESVALVEEKVEAEAGEEEDDDDIGVIVVYEDTGDDSDDDRSSADQQPASPVVINGRILDYLEEISDLKGDPDLLSSRSNSLSDAISESSMQEVSSAPVKPFVHAEEAMEASWTTATKPDFIGASNQLGHEEDFSESRNCSDVGKNLPHSEEKLPEIGENLKPFEPDVVTAEMVLDLKPVTVEIEEEDLSADKANQIKFEVISDIADVKGDSVALKCEISINVNSTDERFAESPRINSKVLSDGLPLPEELSESEAVDESEHVLQATKECSDDTSGLALKVKAIAESVRINGKAIEPVTVEIEEEDMPVDKANQIKFEVTSDIADVKGDNVALKGEILINVNSSDERFAESPRINSKVLSDDLALPEELSEPEAVDEGEHVLQATKEGSDDTSGLVLKGEAIAESVWINGKSLSNDSQDNPSLSKIMTTDEPIRQLGQEMSECGEPHLLVTEEVSGDDSSVICVREGLNYIECAPVTWERSLQPLSESTRELVCLESNCSEEPLNVNGILEELVLQPGGQYLDVVDGTSAVVSDNSVNIVAQEQPSPLIASSKENREDYELDFDTSTGGDSGRKDDDGLAEAILVEGRVHHAAKQEEIEEIMRSDDANNFIFELKKPPFSTDFAHESNDNTREVDRLASKGAVHEVGLQANGGFSSGVLKYLPLEIGLICLLIALVSYILWYLEVSSPVP